MADDMAELMKLLRFEKEDGSSLAAHMIDALERLQKERDEARDGLRECVEVLDSKEMSGVWGFLYAHGFKWTGKVLDMRRLRGLVG